MQWIMLYSNVTGELIGEDREAALAVIDDDEAFDRWLRKYDQNQRPKNKLKGNTSVDQQTFLEKYAIQVGGESD
jgi:hypothetical protein